MCRKYLTDKRIAPLLEVPTIGDYSTVATEWTWWCSGCLRLFFSIDRRTPVNSYSRNCERLNQERCEHTLALATISAGHLLLGTTPGCQHLVQFLAPKCYTTRQLYPFPTTLCTWTDVELIEWCGELMERAVQETLYSEEDLKVMFGMFDLTRRGWISKQQYSQGAHRLLYLISCT